jgi:murein DD-endopeptidase MepM/ murein hydrolase activator NlpD
MQKPLSILRSDFKHARTRVLHLVRRFLRTVSRFRRSLRRCGRWWGRVDRYVGARRISADVGGGVSSFLRCLNNFEYRRLFVPLCVAAALCILPTTSSFDREDLPYWGDFSWHTDIPARLSAGNFLENGRGGLEEYIPKLRLIEYDIERGDTLWSISKEFDVDPDSIISTNVFTNVHAIREGDAILVPNMRGIFVHVGEEDTILRYATTYDLPPDFIIEVNDLRSSRLVPGMKLFLPGARYGNMERAYALGEAFSKPCHGRLTSRYGYRIDPFTRRKAFHSGIDIATRTGTAVHAAQGGTVVYVGKRAGYGRTIILEHRFGYRTLYGHLDSYDIRRGQTVSAGQIIGRVGNTGRSTGPHLHFEIWLRNRKINPLTQTNMAVR